MMNKYLLSLWMFSQLTAASTAGNNLRGPKRSQEVHQSEFQRRLAESAAERFAYWTPEKIKSATPIDLKIDAVSGDAYLSGLDGNLESYKRAVDRFEEDGEEPMSLYWDSVVSLDDLMKNNASSSATQFVQGHKRRGLEIIPKEQMNTGNMISLLDDDTHTNEASQTWDADRFLNRIEKGKPQSKSTSRNKADDAIKAKRQWKRKSPKLRQLRPSRGSTVKDQTTFRAKVLPADGEITAVYLQLTDFQGETSNYISLQPVSSRPNEKMYEVSLGGFVEAYAGTEWSYKIIVQESGGVQYSFVNIPFTVAGGKTMKSSAPTATPQVMHTSMNSQTVANAEWPHGGAIQSSTGRILFDFGGETHVCSGTVVNDGGIYNERSIILTAAHCAYDDISKQFAANAIFIPDQAGSKAPSDFDCSNDKYGCWYLSFAVVEKGWSDNSFPKNAEFDYAFFVVHDFTATHIEGYVEGLTGYLDQDVIPANLDFSADPQGKFFSSFGYSEDYDPSFRYCAGDVKSIKEVPDYTNLWLPRCNLQGGASGGPWMVDMDTSGVGTVMSLNSWGFIDGPGMAGPSLQTSSGSKAQCLFNVARTVQDPGSTRGYAIACK